MALDYIISETRPPFFEGKAISVRVSVRMRPLVETRVVVQLKIRGTKESRAKSIEFCRIPVKSDTDMRRKPYSRHTKKGVVNLPVTGFINISSKSR